MCIKKDLLISMLLAFITFNEFLGFSLLTTGLTMMHRDGNDYATIVGGATVFFLGGMTLATDSQQRIEDNIRREISEFKRI